jgi:hypothetical protein
MTARGSCNATLVAIIAELQKRQASERNPDVRRGLQIAIYELKNIKEAEGC